MSNDPKNEFLEFARTLAKKSGIEVEEASETSLDFSYRSSAGNDEPTSEDFAVIRRFAKSLSEKFPEVKKPNVASLDYCDEWVELAIDLTEMFPQQPVKPRSPSKS